MKILITGASGFTGTHLTKALLHEGHEVCLLARKTSKIATSVSCRIQLITGDICDLVSVEKAVKGMDQVYHLAASFRDASATRENYWNVNMSGTKNVVNACIRFKVNRLIHCSTMGVHGHVSQIPSNEESPFNPGDEYQRTKLAAEEYVHQTCQKEGLPYVVVRPAGIYGPGDLRFLKLFKAIQKGCFFMAGSGETLFHPVYIDDLIQGFLLCGQKDAVLGEAVILGGVEFVSLNEMTRIIADVLKVKTRSLHFPVGPLYALAAICETVCLPLRIRPPLYKRRVDFFTHNRAFTIAKARRLLDYKPKTDLKEGIRRTAEWYQSCGYLK